MTVQLPLYPFKNGQRLEVVVTEVLSPWEFWVQPVGTELDLLMEEMWLGTNELGDLKILSIIIYSANPSEDF